MERDKLAFSDPQFDPDFFGSLDAVNFPFYTCSISQRGQYNQHRGSLPLCNQGYSRGTAAESGLGGMVFAFHS